MRSADWLTLLVALVAGILIPVLVLVARAARRSGVIEQKLDDLTSSEAEQDKRLTGIFDGLDRRLRWLEERIWGRDPRFPRDRGRSLSIVTSLGVSRRPRRPRPVHPRR